MEHEQGSRVYQFNRRRDQPAARPAERHPNDRQMEQTRLARQAALKKHDAAQAELRAQRKVAIVETDWLDVANNDVPDRLVDRRLLSAMGTPQLRDAFVAYIARSDRYKYDARNDTEIKQLVALVPEADPDVVLHAIVGLRDKSGEDGQRMHEVLVRAALRNSSLRTVAQDMHMGFGTAQSLHKQAITFLRGYCCRSAIMSDSPPIP